MQKQIKREIHKSTQPYFHSGLRYLSDIELSKTSDANFQLLSNSRGILLTVDDGVEKDLEHFSKKAMKSIWE